MRKTYNDGDKNIFGHQVNELWYEEIKEHIEEHKHIIPYKYFFKILGMMSKL